MSDLNDTNNGDEGDAERALREGLRTPALSPEAMQRIRAATQAEWRAQRAGAGACANPPVVAGCCSFGAHARCGGRLECIHDDYR